MFANAFRNTKAIEYDGILMPNVFRNILPLFKQVLHNYQVEEYTIQGSPDAAVLATILYNDPELYWVLFLLNDVSDPFEGWILSENELHMIATDKYGDPYGLHHYVDVDGRKYYDVFESDGIYYDIGDTDKENPFHIGWLEPVRNIDYLTNLNEERRVISIINPAYINDFVGDLKREFNLNVEGR